MKNIGSTAHILERAQQRIGEVATAGDREVMLHVGAQAQGWIDALQTEKVLSEEQCQILSVKLEALISSWVCFPE